MNHAILLVTFWLVIGPAAVWLMSDAVEVRSSEIILQSGYERCLRDNELSESLATLKQQYGPEQKHREHARYA